MSRYKIMVLTTIIAWLPAAAQAKSPFKEGNRLYLQGEYAGALQQYNDFVQKEPDRFEGYYNAGNALFRQEQYGQALGMYKKALELKKDDADTLENIKVTEERIKEQPKDKKQDQNKDQNKEQNKDQNQQGNNGEKNNDGNKQQDRKDKQGKEQSKGDSQSKDKQEQGNGQQTTENRQPQEGNGKPEGKETEEQRAAKLPQGMDKDRVQALLNQLQNQEQNLRQRGYFSQQPKPQGQQARQPDVFNMTPQEMQQYMMRKMFDPDFEPQQRGNADTNKKDW